MSSYQNAITDRSEIDIEFLTDKAYQNVSDWVRLYGNAKAARGLVQAILGISIDFDTVPTMDRYGIPTFAQLNTILANIERIRLAADLPADPELVNVNVGWGYGAVSDAPTYEDVNSWERVLEIIELAMKPIADAAMYPWVANAVTPVRRARCGIAKFGANLTFNNRFRKYL